MRSVTIVVVLFLKEIRLPDHLPAMDVNVGSSWKPRTPWSEASTMGRTVVFGAHAPTSPCH